MRMINNKKNQCLYFYHHFFLFNKVGAKFKKSLTYKAININNV